jgi:SMODS-associated and fused to various effectors sensor domain
MTGPADGPASRSGVRRGGDAYQDLMVWGAAMRVIGPDSRFTQVELEIAGAGNVDDVVLRSPTGDRYGQVKWATTTASQVDEQFMTASSGREKSLLQKLYASYRQLRAAGQPPTLELITNRTLDGSHPLLGHVDGRSDRLMPYAGQADPATEAGKALQAWADHIPAARDDLLDLLDHLVFRTGLTITAERDHVQTLMLAAGLEGTEDALQRGLDCVAAWVIAGKRIMTAAEIRAAADELGLRRSDPAAILVVQAIDTDPHADEATIALDWVDLYDGDSPSLRFQPRDSSSWTKMDHDLTSAAAALENAGWRSTLIRGALRQATFFRVGTVLPAVRHHTLRYIQGPQPWSTDTPKAPIPSLQTSAMSIAAGTDIAVAIGMAVNPTTAVLTYIQDTRLPIHHLLTILPGAGAGDQTVASAGQAVAYAQTIRDLVREDLENHPDAPRVHLFLAGPGGLALLLGHRWNRIRPTIIYEHLGPGRGYTPAFTVGA